MRIRLPDRRPGITASFTWPRGSGYRVDCAVGFDPVTGDARELFLRVTSRVGSEVDHLVDDVAVLISRLLQHGEAPTEIARRLGRLPTGEPASVAGVAIDLLAKLDREVKR